MTIDMKKQYRTRDGREVRIYAVDVNDSGYTVHGAINNQGCWTVETWMADGRYDRLRQIERDIYDLIEVKPRIKREVWVNVYPGENTHCLMHLTKESADRLSMPNRIACVKLTIDCEEGEGLSNGYCEYGKGLSNG